MAKPDRRAMRRAEARALQLARPLPSAELTHARKLAPFPVVGAWLGDGWQDVHQLIVGGIARARPDGGLAGVRFLADLGCMGVKQAVLRPKITRWDFETEIGRAAQQTVRPVPVGTLAQVVREVARWSVACGMPTTDDQAITLAFLGDEASDTTVEVPLGSDGKPMLVPGPFDDAPALMKILAERFGPGGFNYIFPMN
jgi:hypothetical protein